MNRLPGFFIKLVFAAVGLLFALCLLIAALGMLVVGLLKWALTGKKPAPFVAFQRFRQLRAGQFTPFSTRGQTRHVDPDAVVDVQAREVHASEAQKNAANDAKLLP